MSGFSRQVNALALSLGVLLVLAAGCSDEPAAQTGDLTRFAYIPNGGDGTFSVIDLETLTVVRTITVSEGEGAKTSHGVAISADGRRLFVGDSLRGVLKVFDATTFEVLAEIDLGIQVHGIDITPDATRVVASGSRLPDKEHKYTYVVDTETYQVLAEIDTNISGHGDTTIDGRYLYINDIIGHRIAVIDLVENDVVTELLLGPEPWPEDAVGPNEIVFAPDGLTAYTADYGAQTVSILDTSDPRNPLITGTIPLSELPHGIDVTSDGAELWVANRASQDVAVIDTVTHEELARVSTSPYVANHLSISPDGTRAFVTVYATEEMTDQTGYIVVLDVASRTEIARFAVGITPHEISFED